MVIIPLTAPTISAIPPSRLSFMSQASATDSPVVQHEHEQNRTEKRPVSRNIEDSGKKEDARVRRTRDRLGDALVDLLVQKPFDDITVQDVLGRAGVSRSTFYTHYRDKNDLVLSDAEDFFQGMATALSRFGDKSERVAPVRELFAHIAEARPFYNALVSGNWGRNISRAGLNSG